MHRPIRILGFTGSRADYFLQRPFFIELCSYKEVDFELIVAGGILDEEGKDTLLAIEQDAFQIAASIRLKDYSDSTHLSSIAYLLTCLPGVVKQCAPDLCVVYADRYETFAFAQTCFHLGKIVLHIEAGDLTYGGTFDDSIRHSISHLSHLYSVTTQASFDVLKSFGICESRIHHSGLLSYDNLASLQLVSGSDQLCELDLDPSLPLILATFHPIPRDPNLTSQESRCFFRALDIASKFANIIVTSPNHDGGREIILAEISKLSSVPNIKHIESLGARRYYSLMSYSKSVPVIVAGNSSSVIKEAPYFNAHSLNVGVRQAGRISASSQINVGADIDSIVQALSYLCNTPCISSTNPYFKENPSRELARFVVGKMVQNTREQLLANHLFSHIAK